MVQDTLVKRFPMTFSGLASLAESIYSDLDLLMKAAGVLAFLAGSYALYFKLLRQTDPMVGRIQGVVGLFPAYPEGKRLV
jgi:hypothetical protein